MKLLPALLSLSAILSSTLRATTLVVSDFQGFGATFTENVVQQSSGAPMANGQGLIRLGYFFGYGSAYSDDELHAILGSAGATAEGFIAANFVPFGEGLVGMGNGNAATGPRFAQRTVNGTSQSGRLVGAITGIIPIVSTPNGPYQGIGAPAGSRVFMLVYDGATPQTSVDWGIFSATSWLMPSNTLVNLTLNTTQVDTQQETYRGVQGGGLRLQPVIPEPGSAALLLAVTGLMIRRRR